LTERRTRGGRRRRRRRKGLKMEDYSNREKNDLEIDDDKEHSVSMLREPFLVRNRKNNTSQIAIVGANTCPIESLDYE
jgi:chloride channel 7